ncbi:hypothetical protein EBU91_03135 [bacterium]|nr:hypothetical protein [bacterium]
MERIQKYLPLATFILVFLLFFKSCGTSSKLKNIEKENEVLKTKVDSLTGITLTDTDMKQLLENTVFWRTLEIEELSDKNKMPINHYKNELQK